MHGHQRRIAVFAWLSFVCSAAILIAAPDELAEKRVDRYVEEQMRESHTPGASIAVLRRGTCVLAKGYGLANVELNVRATKDSVYELLSVSKLFTAAAILLLVENGQVSLDATVPTYLPDSPEAWKEVTVRHLLSHCSGITDYTDIRPFLEMIRQDAAPEELMRPVKQRPLDFAPGSRARYSNSNYFVLGMILEKVTGTKYAEFLRERLFVPLAMTATRVNEMTAIIQQRASGYHWLGDDGDQLPPVISGYHGKKNVLQNAVYVSPTRKWAAGAVVSSAADMAKWEEAIVSGKLLRKSTWELMAVPGRTTGGTETGFGLGTELSSRSGRHLVGYQGGGLAFNATFVRCVEDQLAVVVLCNQTSAPSKKMAIGIASFYVPELSYARMQAIVDPSPDTTSALRQLILDARAGKAETSSFAPDAQQSAQFINRAGPLFLGRLGDLKTFELLEHEKEGSNQTLTYRTIFGDTTKIWVIKLNQDKKVVQLQPTDE